MSTTIFVNHATGTYKAYYGLGSNGKSGWYVMFLDERGNSRTIDGGKIYNHRANAYRRAKFLNDSIPSDHNNWYYVDQRDGSCGGYVLATNKIDALRDHARCYGLPQKSFRIKECPDHGDE